MKTVKNIIKWAMILAAIFSVAVIAIMLVFNRSKGIAHKQYPQNRPRYSTGVTEDGMLRLVYYANGSAYDFDCQLSAEGVLTEHSHSSISDGENDCYLVYNYEAASAGQADIFTKATNGGNDFTYQLYHVSVDSDLKISYTVEDISEEQFEELTDKEQPT